MSVGHVARELEQSGIPTTAVYVRAFRHVVEEMKLPRTVTTRHPMGRPLGPADSRQTHRFVARTALELLDTAVGPTIVDLERPFQSGTRA